ncbi:MAG: sugar phosphate isomerase/epimerase [Planctomycetaceae bacterium]|jgi:sugar phosphate isomerase/epimerase
MHTNLRMTRRNALAGLTALGAGVGSSTQAAEAARKPPITGMGVVIFDCGIRRRRLMKQNPDFDLFEPTNFLEHCQSLGAGGIQVSLGVMTSQAAADLHERARELGMYIEAIVKPPEDKSDLARFESEVRTAREAGALAARTVIIPGRRYERFKTFAEFQEFEKRGQKMVELAVPIVEKHKVPLAIENHKDQRIEDRVALLERISSQYVGACVDTGNSFALLDDLYGTIEALAPFAFSVHLKDQSLSEYDEGFLLGDVPLGEGSFDLRRIVAILRAKKPAVRFSLEVITRDALKVPCLTDRYWKLVPDAAGPDLARTLRFVRGHVAKSQSISKLPMEQQLQMEDANVRTSLKYASEVLDL